ncbi:hypothetical protein, partial [Escherichia coli]|uniref:hypothetical protein n=1 Tax=Escherichia coli TaxID=562 RepID=UPI002915D037
RLSQFLRFLHWLMTSQWFPRKDAGLRQKQRIAHPIRFHQQAHRSGKAILSGCNGFGPVWKNSPGNGK